MTKRLQVTANLVLQHKHNEIKIQNDHEGSLIVQFPDNTSFNNFLKTKLPFKPNNKTIAKANTTLYEKGQPVIIKVKNEDWMVLGRSHKPEIKYAKVAVPYLSYNTSWKTVVYFLSGGIGAAFLYLLIRKRS